MTIHRIPLSIRNEFHEVGEQVHVERHAIRQALAWRVSAEFSRRHPGDILVTEMHPAGGQYDCVAINARAFGEDIEWEGGWRTVAMMNKATPGDHIAHQGWFEQSAESERFNWLEVLLCPDFRAQIIEPLEQCEGLPSPKRTPSTTDASIGHRVLAAFTERTMFTAKPWVLLNGYLDTSGGGGGVREDLFGTFPGLMEHRRVRRADDLFGIAEYRYWFVVEGTTDEHSDARLGIDAMHGTAFTPEGPVDLMERYRECGRRIDAVASEVCPAAY